MRGLNPNHVLVLVDGVRRHTSANIDSDAGVDFGSTPVDLNMIPAAAIDHIEILEDGAAALYGSDAIAGVVNIITKKASHGLSISSQTGANAYNGDGWQAQVNADGGLKLGRDGYLHLSGQFYHTDHMVVNTADHRLLGSYPLGADTSGYYTGPVKLPLNSNKIMSTPEETRETLSIDFGKPITDEIDSFGLITYGHRAAQSYETYRLPTIAPTYYPWGFEPLDASNENDYAATLGLRGSSVFGFKWDVSTTYGADEDSISTLDNVNTGLLAATGYSPTSMQVASYRMAQWTNDANFRRNFNIGHKLPMLLAFGAEHRLEMYDIEPGSTASYLDGGSQAVTGIAPQNAGNWSRDVWAGYLDTDFHPLRAWDFDLAGRIEHYTDVGNTENGKVSSRYDISRRVALRGTISNGFRAPTLAEEHYSTANAGPNSAGGLLPASSGAARSLGATPLKPERSTNLTGGVVLEPVDGWHIEADAYQINIRDRLVQGGTTYGETAVTALQSLGVVVPSSIASSAVSASYITNGASTRTQGVDIKSDYTFHFSRYGTLNISAGLDLNRTRVTHIGESSTGSPLLNAQNVASFTGTYPRSKLILDAMWRFARWDVNVRQSRYGSTTNLLTYDDWATGTCPNGGSKQYSGNCFEQFKNTPRWLTDLEVGYQILPRIHLALGANDIFNVRPRRVPNDANYVGGLPYDYQSAQVPITGGYYYGRVNMGF